MVTWTFLSLSPSSFTLIALGQRMGNPYCRICRSIASTAYIVSAITCAALGA
jgi:hypothetical protein